MMNKKIIFLDFDGVMDTAHYDNYVHYMGLPEKDRFGVVFDPDCVMNLGRIVDATGAEIVVTSTWKDYMTHGEILEMWRCRDLPGVVVGITPSCSRHRGDEIDAWLDDCGFPCEYVIIDDMDESQFNEHQYEHLFTVNPYMFEKETVDQGAEYAYDKRNPIKLCAVSEFYKFLELIEADNGTIIRRNRKGWFTNSSFKHPIDEWHLQINRCSIIQDVTLYIYCYWSENDWTIPKGFHLK